MYLHRATYSGFTEANVDLNINPIQDGGGGKKSPLPIFLPITSNLAAKTF